MCDMYKALLTQKHLSIDAQSFYWRSVSHVGMQHLCVWLTSATQTPAL